MPSIIEVKNVSKSYTITHEAVQQYTTLRDVMAEKAKKIFSFPRWKSKTIVTKEEFWALKDISFNIEQGDRFGIIGRNGAGKSTLFKILSRITEPTTGSVKIKGKVASLLEVGTGFHPELTGRENIFLNGAIIGMSRADIKKHFDAIVDFAEIEKFLDTPVKRYSSGMYVRLAFAVAAHLDSEILIVDEVLAVGDAEFQKKCLGKMGDISKGEGRTVLFVSHNMAAIKAICTNGIYLKSGKLIFEGGTDAILRNYLSASVEQTEKKLSERTDRIGNEFIKVLDITFRNCDNESTKEIMAGDYLKIDITFEKNADIDLKQLIVACGFSDAMGTPVVSWVSDEMNIDFGKLKGNVISLAIPSFNLRRNIYNFNFQISYKDTAIENFCDSMMAAASINVLGSDFFKSGRDIRSGSSLLLNANFLNT